MALGHVSLVRDGWTPLPLKKILLEHSEKGFLFGSSETGAERNGVGRAQAFAALSKQVSNLHLKTNKDGASTTCPANPPWCLNHPQSKDVLNNQSKGCYYEDFFCQSPPRIDVATRPMWYEVNFNSYP